jgi:hypothetical protein
MEVKVMSTHSVDIVSQLSDIWGKTGRTLKRYRSKISWTVDHMIDRILGRQVSVVHLIEAKERFRTLNAIVNFHREESVHHGTPPDPDKGRAIQSCMLELEEAEKLLTRDQRDLNDLWRILTRVRNLLLEHILDDCDLTQQLDYCREEAFRLDVTQDPVVSDMLQKLAEATDENHKYPGRIKRHVRALNERFNTLRTKRIYDQYVKMRIYRSALLVLAFLSTIIIVLTPELINFTTEEEKDIEAALFPKYEFAWSSSLYTVVFDAVVYHIGYLVGLCKTNVLAFVFISGLIGGYFSVVLRVRDHTKAAGEGAYFKLYVLSRPLIGALGAMIVYILFMGGFVSTGDLIEQLGKVPDPNVFGFAFLSGFSERILFPNFR